MDVKVWPDVENAVVCVETKSSMGARLDRKDAKYLVWELVSASQEAWPLADLLTETEQRVFNRLVLTGGTNDEIAEAMGTTPRMVKFHVANILRKTGCKTRTRLIVAGWKGTVG